MGILSRPGAMQRPADEDEGVLAEHGYKQELTRSWGLLQNFGVSFSIIVSLLIDSGRVLFR